MAGSGLNLEGKSPIYGFAIGAVLGGLALGLFAWQFRGPMNKDIASEEKKLAKLNEKIREGRAAKQKLPQFREEFHRLELDLEKLKQILPPQRKTEVILRNVRNLAEQGDFDLRLFKPAKTVAKEFYDEWPIAIEMAGNYHNLALFFDRISRFRRILNIDKLEITPNSKQTESRTIVAKFEAKTFVYREAEAQPEENTAAPPKAGKAGGKKP